MDHRVLFAGCCLQTAMMAFTVALVAASDWQVVSDLRSQRQPFGKHLAPALFGTITMMILIVLAIYSFGLCCHWWWLPPRFTGAFLFPNGPN